MVRAGCTIPLSAGLQNPFSIFIMLAILQFVMGNAWRILHNSLFFFDLRKTFNLSQILAGGAPGLDFETWDSTNFNCPFLELS